MRETRHHAGALRYITNGPSGLLEGRITPNIAALIIHTADCPAEQCTSACDAEALAGADVLAAWQIDDDAGVWNALARYALEQEVASVPQPPVEPSADQRAFAARLREAGRELRDER